MKIDDTDEKRIYTSLSEITKSKSNWEALIPDVGKLLDHSSDKIKAKNAMANGGNGIQTYKSN
jgi:hypothetical protein